MQATQEIAIGFQILAMRIISYSINEDRFKKGGIVGFAIHLDHLFSERNDHQIVRVGLEIGHTPEEVMVNLQLECEYKLTDYRDWLNVQPETHRQPGTMPMGLATTLNSISISTARGVLFERLRGTTLQDIVLPVIDPSNFQLAE